MKSKAVISALCSLTFIYSSFTIAAPSAKLQVAVIEGSISSKDIASGNYQKTIALVKSTKSKLTRLEKSVALCVAYLKTNALSLAEEQCSNAIAKADKLSNITEKKSYITAISYSNRAIARYLRNDIDGAMSDLSIAKTLSNNDIVNNNFIFLAQQKTIINPVSSDANHSAE